MKKIIILVIIFLLILVPIGGRYLYARNYVKNWDGKVFPKSFVNGVDISGHTRESAAELLKAAVKPVYEKKIIIKDGAQERVLNYKELNPNHNIEEIINKLSGTASDSGVFDKMRLLKNAEERNLTLNFQYDKKPIEEIANKIESMVNRQPSNAYIKYIKPGYFTVENEVVGKKVDKESLYSEIISKVNDNAIGDEIVNVKVEEIKPQLTGDVLRQINKRIASFSTYYGGSPQGRAVNVELTTRLLNGKLVMPGETFSFNEATGPRTVQKGFQPAPIIVKNKLIDGLGGGVCQVSTTLYNAVLRSGLKSTSRANHTLAPAYVPPGFDATVSEEIDYKFKNTLNYPIYIEGLTSNGNIYFNIYSNSSLSDIKYDLANEVYETDRPEIVYKKDPTLPKGNVEKEESPHTGYKVKVYLVAYQNGNEVSRQIISNDTYARVDGVYRVGTKK